MTKKKEKKENKKERNDSTITSLRDWRNKKKVELFRKQLEKNGYV